MWNSQPFEAIALQLINMQYGAWQQRNMYWTFVQLLLFLFFNLFPVVVAFCATNFVASTANIGHLKHRNIVQHT